MGSWIREVWYFSNEVNTCINKLLIFFHGGCLWLDTRIYVDVDLICTITGFPKEGVDPKPLFAGKEQGKGIFYWMKEKYNLT